MFIKEGLSLNTDQLQELISSRSIIVPHIPALVRKREEKLEYLLIGQKQWQNLPATLVTETKLSHIQHFEEGEPLVIVHLTLASPSTDTEHALMRLYIDSISPRSSPQPAQDCDCEKQKMPGTRPGCAGCSYCGGCEPYPGGGYYCYRACVCSGVQYWCLDRGCGTGCG